MPLSIEHIRTICKLRIVAKTSMQFWKKNNFQFKNMSGTQWYSLNTSSILLDSVPNSVTTEHIDKRWLFYWIIWILQQQKNGQWPLVTKIEFVLTSFLTSRQVDVQHHKINCSIKSRIWLKKRSVMESYKSEREE